MQTSKDLLLSNYNYDIPQELIAKVPINNRSDSKLIILNRENKTIQQLIMESKFITKITTPSVSKYKMF